MVSLFLAILSLFMWAFSESSAKLTQVLYMSEDGEYDLPGFYIKPVSDFNVQNFSICAWLHLNHIRQTNSPIIGFSDEILEYLTYRNLAFYRLEYDTTIEYAPFYMAMVDEFGYEADGTKFDWLLGKWFHFCYVVEFQQTINDTHGVVTQKTYIDGEIKSDITYEGVYYSDWGNGSLNIGIAPTSFDFDEASPKETFGGMMTELNFINRTLTEDEVFGLLNCSESIQGDIINWEALNETVVQVGNPNMKEEDSEKWCNQDKDLLSSQIIVPKVPQPLGKKHCSGLNGKLPVPMPELRETYSQALLDVVGENVCGSGSSSEFWIGLKWNQEKDAYVDLYSGEKPHVNITEEIYDVDIPSKYECVYNYDGELSNVECKTSWPCLNCIVQPSTIYFLKGLCPTAYLDSWQTLGTIDDTFRLGDDSTLENMKFLGFSISQVYFNEAYQRWTIQSLTEPDNILILKPKNIWPLGRYTWIVGNKSNICPQYEPNQEIRLTFSACRQDQFTCDSGHCVDINYRCDHNTDCEDQSDEIGCELITFKKGYLKGIVPKETVTSPRNVTLMVNIKSFPEIDAIKLSYKANFNLRMSWSDHRMTMNDLNTFKSTSNVIDDKHLHLMWMPVLSFSNALGPFQTKLDEQTFGTIRAIGNSTLKSKLEVTEGQMYAGEDQQIIIDKEYFLEFGCEFDLLTYPFDTQVCSIILESVGNANDSVLLQPDIRPVNYMGKRQLIEYQVVKEEMIICTVEGINMSYAQVDIMFKRKFEYHISNTFLQTLLLLVISYMTFYFEVDNFTDKIMVVLTTMLVIATLQSTTQQSLPKTAYFKLIDFWFLFSLNVFILTFMFHTFVGYLHGRLSAEKEKDDKKKSQVVSKVQGLVSMMIMNNRKNGTKDKVENGLVMRKGRNSPNASKVSILSNEMKKDYPDHAFYAPPEEEERQGLPQTCQKFGKWLFVIVNVVFIIAFASISIYFHYNSGVIFGKCAL